MKIFKNLLLISVLTISIPSLAFGAKDASGGNDYYANYYEDEGSLLFKIRGFYAITEAKIKGLPDPTNRGAAMPKKLAQSGYGFDTAMTIFATDNIAAEVAFGVGFFKTKSSVLAAAVAAYGTSSRPSGKKNQILMVPMTLAAQYHIAPFGGIRPYIGAGYNGTYMYTRSSAIKVNSGHGPVVQLGVDFIAKDDTLFTIDVRQYFLKSKIMFKKGFTGASDNIPAKITWNPLVISAGVGFKF